jgi:hypothetical protein
MPKKVKTKFGELVDKKDYLKKPEPVQEPVKKKRVYKKKK